MIGRLIDPTGTPAGSGLQISLTDTVGSASPRRLQRVPSSRLSGVLLAVAGGLPFALGPLLKGLGGSGALPAECLLRIAIGLPCPFCGATRAFSLAASGDPGFLSYNGLWVLVAAVAVAAGLFTALTRSRYRAAHSLRRNDVIFAVAALMAAGWIWALVNRGLITA